MPNPGAERPLRKVTLNLFEDDCQILEDVLGQGWTTRVRDAAAKLAHSLRPNRSSTGRRTLGDLE